MTGLSSQTRRWLEGLGFTVTDDKLWREALTHGSTGVVLDYDRLEFVGDRVLGLSIADWLYRHSEDAEGQLAQRLNALVSKGACAGIAREIGASPHIALGKQARDDGAADSDNVLGDVMEALLGANFMEAGFEPTSDLIQHLWADALKAAASQAKHPKSALQEWAAGNRYRPPSYDLVERSGPDHKARFTVRVRVRNVGEAEATAHSKQEAETSAARKFMEQFG